MFLRHVFNNLKALFELRMFRSPHQLKHKLLKTHNLGPHVSHPFYPNISVMRTH